MKVIEILNKIANGEEVPHFKIFEIEYFLNDRGNLREKEENRPSEDTRWYIDGKWLNTEVEIIEEDKKIEKVPIYVLCDYDFKNKDDNNNLIATNIIDKAFEEYAYKINEIIDKLEENK